MTENGDITQKVSEAKSTLIGDCRNRLSEYFSLLESLGCSTPNKDGAASGLENYLTRLIVVPTPNKSVIDETENLELIELWHKRGIERSRDFENSLKSIDPNYRFEVIGDYKPDEDGINWNLGIAHKSGSNKGFVLPRNNKRMGYEVVDYYEGFVRAGSKIDEIERLASVEKIGGTWAIIEKGKVSRTA